MTLFYANITVCGPSQPEIIKYLTAAGRNAFVSPAIKNFTVIYDSECEEKLDPVQTAKLAKGVSNAFSCKALSVINWHGYLLIYQLYENGEIVDEYFSERELFDFDVLTSYLVSGDVRALCSAFGRHGKASLIEKILNEGYEHEHLRHFDIVTALGLPEIAVSFGYGAISEGIVPDGVEFYRIENTRGGGPPAGLERRHREGWLGIAA